MSNVLFWIFILGLVVAIVVVAGLLVRGYFLGASPVTAIFGERPRKRLDIVERTALDGRRRLLLIRRDEVEHLIMTGGPVDIVIETNIERPRDEVAQVTDGQDGSLLGTSEYGFPNQ